MHITIKNSIVNHLDEKNHRDDKSVDDHIPNGHSSSSSSGDNIDDAVDAQGGRLKFFKDGKVILELAQAKFGEKVLWIKASNGTFWPPHSLITATSRQENCATSDDNSSLQSSPWQRDHSWKQVRPTKSQLRHFEKNFMFRTSNNKKTHRWLLKIPKRKLGKNPAQEIALKSKECQLCSLNVNECDIIECNNEKRPKGKRQPSTADLPVAAGALDKVVKNLMKRFQKHVIIHKNICSGGELVSPNVSPSPRKRILRDFDKVSLTDELSGCSLKSESCSDSNAKPKSSVVVAVATASAAFTTTTLSMTSSAMSATGSDCNAAAAASAAAAAAMAAYANRMQSSQKKRARCSNTRLPSSSNKTEEKTLLKNTNYSISSLLGKKDSTDSPSSLPLSSFSPSSASTQSRDQPLLNNVSSSAVAALSPLVPMHSEYPLLQTCLLSSPPTAHQYSNQQTYFGSCNRSTDHYFFVQNNLKKPVDYSALRSSPSSAFFGTSGKKPSNSVSLSASGSLLLLHSLAHRVSRTNTCRYCRRSAESVEKRQLQVTEER